jgi:TP901 family phage tail tape measure protein
LRGVVLGLAKAWLSVEAASRFMSTGAEFNQAIVSLGALTGQSGKELAYLEQKTLETGKAMGVFAGDVAKAMGVIGSEIPALLTAPDAMIQVTEAALTLAAASRAVGEEMTDAQAAIALTAGLNQWGASAEEAARFTNVLAAGAAEGSSMISQTADVMKNAGTVAASAGVSFEQFNAIIQVMAAKQLKASEAGTALKGVLLSLLTK